MRKYTPYICMPSSLLAGLARRYSGNEFMVFVVLWAKAVEFRSQILPAEYGIRNLAIDMSLTERTAAGILQRLHNDRVVISGFSRNDCNIEVLADGRIKVYGVWSYHQKLKGWKGNCGAFECPALGHLSAPESRRVKELTESTQDINYSADEPRTHKPLIQTIPGIANIGRILVSGRKWKASGDAKRQMGQLIGLAGKRLAGEAVAVLEGILADITTEQIFKAV